jgi:GNAT superfamily N-acetyltransferase
MLRLETVTRPTFISNISSAKEDAFAKTFVAKCDMLQAWDICTGLYDGDKLAGAIVFTFSKREPKVCNLQLLHTFHAYRGKKIAKTLCQHAIDSALHHKAEYFRVSSEFDAVNFYKKCGFQFVGKQKTAELSLFRLTSSNISENNFEPDGYIWKQMNRKGKGGCIECYFEYKGVSSFIDE